jgi:hypothetical protein
MNVAPEYSVQTQTKIPCALAELHNFIRINDPDDFSDDGPGHGGPRNPTFTLHEIDGDQRWEFPEEELGQFISPAEKARAEAFRDRIGQVLWDQYVLEGVEEEYDSMIELR